MTFRQIFTGRTKKSELLGLFLAMLELIRRRRIFIRQEKSFGEIHVFLRNQQDEPAGTPPLAASPETPSPNPEPIVGGDASLQLPQEPSEGAGLENQREHNDHDDPGKDESTGPSPASGAQAGG
jgi:hypothetical protein